MKCKQMRRPRGTGVACGLAVVILAGSAFWLPGCSDSGAKSDGQTKEIPAPGSLFVPSVTTKAVRGEDFVEHIELPGVAVHGWESTPLFAKVGGFVKEVRRIGRTKIRGRIIQITDTEDRQTYRVRDIEFRMVGSPPQNARNAIFRAATPAVLKKQQPELYDAYQKAEMMVLDIGSDVEAGTLLATLDIPEMADDLKKQQATVERMRQTVFQKQAAVNAANAHVGQAEAEHVKAQKASEEVLARLERDRKELDRIKRLGENVDRALREEVGFKVAASTAALASAAQQIKSAEKAIAVAKATVKKAEADKKVAEAQVKESKAELNRLKTLEDYAFIRAPFAGTITRRFVDHGAFVQPAQGNSGARPLFAITQTDKIRVVIPVPGRKSYKIRAEQTCVLHTIGGLPGVTVQGTIARSAKTLDPASRILRVEMHLKNPAENSRLIRDGRSWKRRAPSKAGGVANPLVTVRPGMFGVVTVRNKWKQLRMVPATAVAGEGTEQYVLQVVGGDNGSLQVVKRYVTVVFNDAKTAGISDGIPVGAQIVAEGVAGLKDGQKVVRKNK